MADVLSTNTTVLNPAKGANYTVSEVQTKTLPPSEMGLTGHALERSGKSLALFKIKSSYIVIVICYVLF